MPEQLTKYPDITLQVLESSGAQCGLNAVPTILRDCPAERLCAFPGGEVCVYGLPELGSMSQISTRELAAQVCPPYLTQEVLLIPETVLTSLAFVTGIAVGAYWATRRRSGA